MKRYAPPLVLTLIGLSITPSPHVHTPSANPSGVVVAASASPTSVLRDENDLALIHKARAGRSRRQLPAKPRLVVKHQTTKPQPTAASEWADSALAIRYANCESGDRSLAQSHYNGGERGVHLSDNANYRGKWQIGWGEWRGAGGSGDPADATETEQDYRAWLIWKARGWEPWYPSYSCAHH